MTGAPLPPGCDAIVPVEETEEGSDVVRILAPYVLRPQHVDALRDALASLPE